MTPTLLLLAALALGQDDAPAPPPGKAKADPQLDFMKAVASSYRFARDGETTGSMTLRPEPAFRMGKQPADTIEEGAIFFWLNAVGRPEAAAQIFFIRNDGAPDGLWIHEFISFADAPFSGERQGRPSWSPRRAGVEFRPVPAAPKPAGSAAARATQMRALARDFRASDHFHRKSWVELRLLPTPVARYGKDGSAVLDGAMFAFATGTDPEAFLFVEARPGKDGPEYHYAFAPMTCWELKGTHQNKVVWNCPDREGSSDIAAPYVVLTEKP